MYEVTIEGGFSATHRLTYADGSTEALHGHDWKVLVCLVGEGLDAEGMVADFTVVQARLDEITARLHHTHLNDHPWFDGLSPTAERVARTICDRMSHDDVFGRSMCSVEVTETPGCSARYVRS